MIQINWAPIIKTNDIPPLGSELSVHLTNLHGTVKYASYSVWNLLYRILLENNIPVSTVAFTDTGKPFFKDSDVFFSLSHSKALCAVAISDCPIGVDIEKFRPTYSLHLIDRSMTEKEKRYYDGDFTRLWCRKEAIAKRTGEGITGYPDHIDTTQCDFIEQLIEYEKEKYWLIAVE